MRILHPPAVGYHLQAAANNNSNPSLQATAAILNRERTITTATTNNNGSSLTSKSNYSSDYTNLNGNSEDTQQEAVDDYDFIRTGDDNVNVTISTQNSVKFGRNPQNVSTNQNFNLNLNQKNLNLNQNRRNVNQNQNFCGRNTSSSPTEQFGDDLKSAENSNENFCNNLNQLNKLKRKEATVTTGNFNGNGNAGRQIFEGNLNVLEAEETNDDDDDVTFECDSNNPRIQTGSRFSGLQLRRDVQDASEDSRDLICNGNHLSNSNIIDTANPSSNRFEEVPLDPLHRSRSGSEELRKNLAKLDLDTNLVSINNQRRNCQQQQNCYNTNQRDDNDGEEDEEEEEEEEEEDEEEDDEVEVLGLHSQHEDNSFSSAKLHEDHRHRVDAEQEVLQIQQQNPKSKHIQIEDASQRTQILENHIQPDPQILSYSSAYSGDTSPDDSLMEEEADAFSPTPSSCASIGSPELGNFTRGIINPNYPGFQHLAHTLSEHFVDHQGDPDDSDLSEFEIELSVESLDENFARFHLNNNNNNESNNNNGGDEEDDEGPPTSTEMDVSSSKDSSLNDELNFNLASNGSTKENCKDKVISLPEIQVTTSVAAPVTLGPLTPVKGCNEIDISKKLISDKTFNVTLLTRENRSQEIQENEENNGIELRKKGERGKSSDKIRRIYESEFITCDLDTYLKKFETASDIKTPPSKEALCFRYEKDVQFAEILRNCPTPDILIKNDKSHHYNQKSRENRPDLLRNVSPKPETRSFSDPKTPCEEVELKDKENLDKNHSTSPEDILIEPKKSIDEISFSITPVDIVGDFGREIEREFGLIVSGYNTSLMSSNTVMDFNKKEEEELTAEPEMEREVDLHFEKTTDAALSDGKDEITADSSDFIAANCIQSSNQELQTDATATCDLLQTALGAPTNLYQRAVDGEEPTQLKDEPQTEHTNEQKLETQNSECESRTQLTNETNESTSKPITKNSATATAPAAHTEAACGDVQSAEKSIPTAVVKPKYQKPSYDERQLPPIGLGFFDRDRAWYDSKNHNNNHHHHHHHNHNQQPHGHQHHHTHHPHQPLQQQTTQTQSSTSSCTGSDHQQRSRKVPQQFTVQLDRNSKAVKRAVSRAAGFSTLTRDKIMTSRRYEKDPRDCSSGSIAIVTPRKKDKNDANMCDKKYGSVLERNNNNNNTTSSFGGFGGKLKSSLNNNVDSNRYDLFDVKEKKETQSAASFDVYNIETALPVIDLEAIENHLKKAKEEERKRRNDREEIRRRLAMGAEDDYFSKIVSADRPGRKPSLQSRLQSGMNLQICFMNEASSDTESPSSDSETCPKLTKSTSNSSNMSRYSSSSSATAHPYYSRPLSVSVTNNNSNKTTSNHILNRPSTLSIGPPLPPSDDADEIDFFTKQARLQIEARMALAQAKDMAHMQMEIERQKQKQSPITEVIRNSLEKVGVDFPPEKRRVSRQMLTDMNIAQLQIIVNELHTQIERLNEHLVQYLMERDDLHMSQDSMLVDIEDLTRYLGAKEQSLANEKASGKKYNHSDAKNSNDLVNQKCISIKNPLNSDNIQNTPVTGGNATTGTTGTTTSASKFMRIASLVKK